MATSKIAVSRSKGTRRRLPGELPVSVSKLRWALVRRLVFVVPVGLLFSVTLTHVFNTEGSGSGNPAEKIAGIGLSITLFFGIIWGNGRQNRAAFAKSGGDPNAAGVLLFGVMPTRGTGTGSGGDQGYSGSSSGGDSFGGCDSGGGDGGGGCD